MLYNKFRPISFSEMKGQEVNRKILRNQIKDNKVIHAYIFYGLHGSGKTTAAKIFSKAINCLNPIDGEPCNKCESCEEFKKGINSDIYEIDAASNNKVEDVAKIKDILKYSPQRNKKVFIFDEAHMLSKAAWNSLLTTIEEAPKNVTFIFCSTELQKFPDTILSRCMKLAFTSISQKDILDNLIDVCNKENIKFEENSLKILSKISNGSMRDALSHLEKCIAFGDLTEENISNMLGVVDQANVFEIIKQIMLGNVEKSLKVIDDLFFLGKDMYVLAQDIVEGFRDIYVYNATKNESLISKNLEYVSCFKVPTKEVSQAINRLYELLDVLRKTDNKKVILEISLLDIVSLFESSKCNINDFNYALENATINVVEQIDNKVIINSKEETKDKEVVNHNIENKEIQKVDYKKDLEINHFNYLHKKVDLLESFDINDKQLDILLNSKIYCTKNSFIVQTPEISKLNTKLIEEKLKEICDVELNILFKK